MTKFFSFSPNEGYRQRSVVAMNASVPTPRFRDILTTSLPFAETRLWMNFYPLPNQPLTASDALIGVWIGPGAKSANDDHVDAKMDYLVGGGNLSVTLAVSHPDLSVPVDLPTNPRDFTSKWRRASVKGGGVNDFAGPSEDSDQRRRCFPCGRAAIWKGNIFRELVLSE